MFNKFARIYVFMMQIWNLSGFWSANAGLYDIQFAWKSLITELETPVLL